MNGFTQSSYPVISLRPSDEDYKTPILDFRCKGTTIFRNWQNLCVFSTKIFIVCIDKNSCYELVNLIYDRHPALKECGGVGLVRLKDRPLIRANNNSHTL